ncbi:MAG: TonB-dependent receptor, partial [Pseudomonadota bacterium]
AVAALLLPIAANAQEIDNDDSDATQLDRLIISAGRTPVEADKTGTSNTVIDAEQIERSQSRYVADVLRQVPGVDVSRTGSFGGFTQVRIRGGEGNNVLVLIDGVEVSETSGGEFDFGSLQTSDIERIEVLRGPQSAFYGSDALSGVISIITKGGRRNSKEAGFTVEYGTDETRLFSGYARGGTETFDGSISISQRITDGFNISSLGNEEDGDDNLTVNGKFSLDVAEGLILDGTARYVNRDSDVDDQPFVFMPALGLFVPVVQDTNAFAETEEVFGALGLTYDSLDEAWTFKARVSGADITRNSFNGAFNSFFNTEGDRYKALGQITHRFDDVNGNRHSITGGYEWERETFAVLPPQPASPGSLVTRIRETESLVAEYRGEFDEQFFLNTAVRHDFNDQFEDATTYSVSSAWKVPGSNTRIHASAGTGVVAPTFFEQFGFIPGTFIGNPNLVPEESFGWDVGIEQKFFDGDAVIDVTYFQQDLRNEIASRNNTVFNLAGTSEREGIEVAIKAYLGEGFSVSGNYTYLDSTDPAGVQEVRRAPHSGSARVDYVSPELGHTFFVEAVFNGTMTDIFSTTPDFITFTPQIVELDSFTVVNVGGSYKLNENFEVYARVENLFDEEYEEVFDYNTQGVEAFFGVRGKY